jgi:hypothetical protein
MTIKRSAYIAMKWVPLANRPLEVRGYKKSGYFACRLEISAAGIKIYTGAKGNKLLANVNWEGLVEMLSKPKKKKK